MAYPQTPDIVFAVGSQVPSAHLNNNQNRQIDHFRGKQAVISPAAITGNVNNWDPTGLDVSVGGIFYPAAQVIRQDLSADVNLSGIARGIAGRILYLINIDASWHIDLLHESTNSTAANRLALPGGEHRRLYGEGSYAKLWYDGAISRWRVLEVHTNAGDHGLETIKLNIFGGKNDSGDAWSYNFAGGYLATPNGSGGVARHAIGIELPVGTIIEELNATVRGNASGVLTMSLVQSNVGGKTTHASDSAPATATDEGLSITGQSVEVAAGETYLLQLESSVADLAYRLYEASVVVRRRGKNGA
jgi:hypothetical protein